MPGTTLGQIIREREANLFVGRGDALAELDNLVNNNWPLVFFLHGIPGVGKTALINKFLLGAPALKTQVLQLDGETIEPTFDGFRAALGAPASATDDRSLIVIDNYEHLLLLDDWLREQLVPFLTANVRLILISRLPPNIGWMTRPASRGIFKAWELTGLETADAVELLQSGALPDYQINRAVELAQGHPLTLVLASTALGNASDTISLQDELAKVSGELAHFFLMDIDDQTLRQAVELGALARRLDHSLLSFMFPRADAGLLHEQLSKLPFVESRADGLKLHQVIAGAVLAAMESENPDKVVQLRRTIWRYLRARDHSRGGGGCGGRQSWRNTVDMIYQLHNPVVREAFFPSGAPPRFVENATAADFDKVMSITEAHDGADMVKIISLWWQLVPAAFRIVRDDGNQVVGYCVATDDHRVPEQLRRMDPLLDAWVRNAKAETQARERSLFVRRWLSETAGESPSPEQGASWIDLKRSYMEMRPDLRRVYVCAYDPSPYVSALVQLQFQVLENLVVQGTNNPPTTAVLDFGPGSVDDWLSRLVAGDLDAHGDLPFDFVRREVLVNGKAAVALTNREVDVVRYLADHRGIAVSRDMLLDDVWGQQHHGGSNVVDVVVRSVRKKLGGEAKLIETVRGVGYRIN